MMIDRIYDEAAAWLVREQDDAMDWEGFTAWLEADPRHRSAYDELAMLDADLDQHSHLLSQSFASHAPAFANDPHPVRWGRWAAAGAGVIAAGLAVVLAVQPVEHDLPSRAYSAGAGRSIEVALRGGAKVELAPLSRLTVKGEQVALQGSGYFDVPHKNGRSLSILAGPFKITDIGTRFSIENEPEGVSVEVAEGTLSVNSDRLANAVALSAGHGLRASSSGTVRLVSVDPRQVAMWRSGKLQFDQVPLSLVARDISRYSGAKVTVDPAIAKQPFSGVIAIDDGEAPARTLAQILSLDVKKVDGGSRLEPRRQ